MQSVFQSSAKIIKTLQLLLLCFLLATLQRFLGCHIKAYDDDVIVIVITTNIVLHEFSAFYNCYYCDSNKT